MGMGSTVELKILTSQVWVVVMWERNQAKLFADIGKNRGEKFAKKIRPSSLRPSISREGGCKKFHGKSSTNSKSQDVVLSQWDSGSLWQKAATDTSGIAVLPPSQMIYFEITGQGPLPNKRVAMSNPTISSQYSGGKGSDWQKQHTKHCQDTLLRHC